MDQELQTYLDTIAKNECYVQKEVLKKTPSESTEIVMRTNPNGSLEGPFIRKQIIAENSLGLAYERIWKAQQEGLTLANIPRIFDFYEINEERFVVMEYLPGKTLEELINSQVLSKEQILALFFDVCHAVTELHEKFSPAIIHRDLKPSNVIISNGKAMLIDFGIARSFHQEAETDTQHFGTRSFAPPEQFGFSQTNQRSDEYALAALLFFCLSKRVPSSKDRDQGFLDINIAPSVSAVLNRALSLDPSARFESVSMFASAVKEAAEAPSGAPFMTASSSRQPEAPYQSGAFQQAGVSQPANAPQHEGTPGTYVPDNLNNPAASWKISEIKTIETKPKKDPNRFFGLKVVWDILVAFGVLIMFTGCLNATLNPISTDALAQMDLLPRALSYLCLFVGWVIPIGYLISARAPLFKLFKVKKKPSRLMEIAVSALFMFVSGSLLTLIANVML